LYGPRKSHPPALCPNPSFDATFEYPAGVIYVLKGELSTRVQYIAKSEFLTAVLLKIQVVWDLKLSVWVFLVPNVFIAI
jgi:hypothetical protein